MNNARTQRQAGCLELGTTLPMAQRSEAAECWAPGLGKARQCLETQSKSCFYPTLGVLGSLVYAHPMERGE